MLTVVIPTYNRPVTLSRAIRSVLGQTHSQFEVVVVDDGSVESAEEVVAGFEDDRLRYLAHETNRGVSAARNTGVRAASSPWVVFLDSDDEMHPEFLAKVGNRIHELPESVGFLWCGTQRVKEHEGRLELVEQRIWSPSFGSCEEAYRSFLKKRRFMSWSGFTMRVDAYWDVGGFDEQMRNAEDVDLFLRLARAYSFEVIEEVLVTYHVHPGARVSRALSARAIGYEMVMNKNIDAVMADREAAHDFYLRIASCYYGSGQYNKARTYGFKAVRQRPNSAGTWIRLAKSWVAPVLKPRRSR